MPAPVVATVPGAFSLGAACGAGLLFLLRRLGRCSFGRHARWVESPHPTWKPGQPQPPPYGQNAPMIALDPAKVDKPSMYAFFMSAVVPRPVAFVSSVGSTTGVNLSPYSYFNIMGHNPPTLTIGMCRSTSRGGGKKDSQLNIEETGEFVVNIISEWCIEAAHHSCGEFDRGVNEMELAGLTPVDSTIVRAPRVGEAAVALECKLRGTHDVDDSSGKPSGTIMIAEVVMIHVAEAVTGRTPTGKLIVDPVLLAPVSRLGGLTYGKTLELYDLGKPDKNGVYKSKK